MSDALISARFVQTNLVGFASEDYPKAHRVARLYLGALGNNGGPTPTIALLPGSLAVNTALKSPA